MHKIMRWVRTRQPTLNHFTEVLAILFVKFNYINLELHVYRI